MVTWNAMPWLRRCLGSLMASSLRPDVLVVDNGSSDGTVECISEEFPYVRLVRSPENVGFGAANNIGLRMAFECSYDHAYLLNQDAWVEKDTIELLVRASRPEYGILSPVQNDASGRMDSNFRKKCGARLDALGGTLADETLVVEVPFVMAAHWLVSRRAIGEVGLFSPAFRQYGEDDNYIDRLHYHGLRCGVVPAAAAVHDRAFRKASREAKMRLKCVSSVVRLSNPGHSFFWRRIAAPLELAGMSVKNLSAVPLRYIPQLVRRYPELGRLREVSRARGAFL